jgi:ribose 1,5-bisphosphokinase
MIEGIAAHDPCIRRVSRFITRDPGAGNEVFIPVTADAFERLVTEGALSLHWNAHGLRYGLPAAMAGDLAAGHDCIANLSRGMLAEAAKRFPKLLVLNITASPEALAERLTARGRETKSDIAQRLSEATKVLPAGLDVITIRNDGPLDVAIKEALQALRRSSTTEGTA